MKPHAIALTLLAWYLMGPPPAENMKIDSTAPLSHWKSIRVYDTADACEAGRTEIMAEAKQDLGAINHTPESSLTLAHQRFDEAIQFAECIATDDPRLVK